MPRLKSKAAATKLDAGPVLDQLDALRQVAAERAAPVQEAQAKWDASGRWFDAASGKLRSYIDGVEHGERESDPAELARLRDAVTDLSATRTVRERVGSSVRYGDTRALRVLDEATNAQREAEGEVARFIAEHPERLQREMLERGERIRDEMFETCAAASASGKAWRRHREMWLGMMERWGISAAELPPLPGFVDPAQALHDGMYDQHRAGGHAAHPRLLVPAPVSVQLRNPADAMRQTPGELVPDEQRRWPREAGR